MTDREALLAAIAANPEDDNTRLVYADLLDEEAGALDAEHAELIRLQCGSTPPTYKPCIRCNGDGKVYNDSGYYERGWEKCDKCMGKGHSFQRDNSRELALLDLLRPHLCPVCPVCEAQERTVCQDCSSRGHIGEFRRGFLHSVTVPSMRTLFESRTILSRVRGRTKGRRQDVWQPTQWARDLMRRCPALQRIEVDDVIREQNHNGRDRRYEIHLVDVPQKAWDNLKKPRSSRVLNSEGGYYAEYRERATAIADLSQAILTTLREMIAAEKGVTA
jgi:uncharacterized protein (TIGR02996 family)